MSRQHLKTSLFQKVTKFSCLDEDLGGTDILHFALSFPSIKAVLLLQNTAEILGLSPILHHITFFVWATQPREKCHTSKQLLCKRKRKKSDICVCVCVALFPSKWSQFCGFWHSITQNNAEKEGVHCSLGLFHIKKKAPKLFLKSPSFTVISTFIEH